MKPMWWPVSSTEFSESLTPAIKAHRAGELDSFLGTLSLKECERLGRMLPNQPKLWRKTDKKRLGYYRADLYAFVLNVKGHLSARAAPPLNAEFFFYVFIDAKNCDALVGDLEERYRTIRKKFGARRANFWYWTQVIRSVGPLAWAATKRMLKAVSGVAALVEVWRRIRS